MSQARFLATASCRVLESRSAAARQVTRNQRRYIETHAHLSDRGGPSRSLQCYGRTRKPTCHVANPTVIDSFKFVRSLSTNIPQPSTSNEKAREPPPPPATSSKKSKIELRPGPAKTSTNAGNAILRPDNAGKSQPQPVRSKTATSDMKPHPTKPPPVIASAAEQEMLKELEGKGVVDIARKDMDEAAKHGILKPPPEGASKLGRLFHQAKELFKFYVAGLKYVGVHWKEVRAIQQRVRSGGPPLTWREHRFILTNKSDRIKLVPFLLIVLIVEELIPLIVLYVPGMLPSTCILPSQRERILAKRHERQRGAYALVKSMDMFKDIPTEEVALKSLHNSNINLLCTAVGISPWGILGMQQHRLKNYLRKIAVEDQLLLSEGQGARLNKEEIATALSDRGFLLDSYTAPQQRDLLRWWLENVNSNDGTSSKVAEDVRTRLLISMLKEATP